MKSPTPPTEPTDEEIATTLKGLREAFEAQQQHFSDMMGRYQDLGADVRELRGDVASLRKRVDEKLGAVRPTCPHCGRAVQRDWKTCAICTKPL